MALSVLVEVEVVLAAVAALVERAVVVFTLQLVTITRHKERMVLTELFTLFMHLQTRMRLIKLVELLRFGETAQVAGLTG